MRNTSTKPRKLPNFTFHAIVLLLLCLLPSYSMGSFLLPTRTVNISNESSNDVYFMCGFKNYSNSFHLLRKGESMIFKFYQYLFPARWCYLYLNDQNHGFFWAYTTRLRCNACNWKIKNSGAYFYRDRVSLQWEIEYLHPLPGTLFNPDDEDPDVSLQERLQHGGM